MLKHTIIIAEAGVNHNGDIELAKKLVDAAVEAKVKSIMALVADRGFRRNLGTGKSLSSVRHPMAKLAALYNHCCIADSVRVAVEARIEEKPVEARFLRGMSPAFAEMAVKASKFNRIMVWYALLYVVVDGYRELKISYTPLDEVLAEGEYESLLRRFRNATFHYQENHFSAKLIDFLEQPESEAWIQDLNKQLEAFFLDTLPIKETIAAMERRDA